ncbi:MAG TPA: putative glycoside hydrolase [Actinomycetota bacterium]|nr:putative glycoside hydrolase [Actinomycetota bacterium]
MLYQRALVLTALVIAAFMVAPPTSPLFSSGRTPAAGAPDRAPGRRPSASPRPRVLAARATPKPTPTLRRERPAPTKAKGITMTGYSAGGENFNKLLGLLDRTELNAVVIDIKNESGEVSWIPTSPRAVAIGGGRRKMKDPRATLRTLKEHGVYVIGRIVTFNDTVLAKARPDLAVQDLRGGVWKDRKDLSWGDPYSREVVEYNLELAREAVTLGFDEIQFDYVRFPTDGAVDNMWYRHRDVREPPQVIRDVLRRAKSELAPMGAYVSADLFGFVTLVEDPGIGQTLSVIAAEVDYVSLMIYPSHYSRGNYGLRDPESSPYETIKNALEKGKEQMAGTQARQRPWLQDFSLRVKYSPRHVQDQIRAAEEAGVDQWLLWNADNEYTEAALKPAPKASRPASTPGR